MNTNREERRKKRHMCTHVYTGHTRGSNKAYTGHTTQGIQGTRVYTHKAHTRGKQAHRGHACTGHTQTWLTHTGRTHTY